MAQVNKYIDKTAYEADTTRDRSQSAVSLIEGNRLAYDGVNIVVNKPSAAIGDLAVYDKTDGAIKFVKSATISKTHLPATLVPLAVVYARKGDKVLIVSLDNATYNGSTAIRWAAPYEVALGGFDLSAGGTFTIKINTTEHTFTYLAGSTPTGIAAIIAANLPNYNNPSYGGWAASAFANEVIMTSNTYIEIYVEIDAVSGCTIRRTTENMKYQTTITGIIINGTIEYVRRNNRIDSAFAGSNYKSVMQYYSVGGSVNTGQKPGSANIIRESVFTKESNPDLVAAYPTYKDYLLGEHMMQYPSAYGSVLRDGKVNTGLIGPLRFVDIRGNSVPRYPAVAAALDYGVVVDGANTGLEAGSWWLPSVEEVYLLMRDRALTAADLDRDPVNRTLTLLGKVTCYGTIFSLWSACELNYNTSFLYYGITGNATNIHKYSGRECRPVSSL